MAPWRFTLRYLLSNLYDYDGSSPAAVAPAASGTSDAILGVPLNSLDGWVMAELRFDDDLCRYVEIRRAVYALTREAIGAVISRALASGDHAAVDTALSLHDWLSTYYGIEIVSDIIARPDARSIEFTV